MDPKERLAAFKNMAEADPENELAHFSLGKTLLELGQNSEAEASLRRTIELSPRHAIAHQLLAEALFGLERREEAVELLEKGLLLAHEKGEIKPRNAMLQRLEELGVPPPKLPEATPVADAASGAEAADASRVRCRRCGRVGARLAEAPFPGETGKRIVETTCQACWREWVAVSIKVINEYRLNLMLPEAQKVYDEHMKEFLGL